MDNIEEKDPTTSYNNNLRIIYPKEVMINKIIKSSNSRIPRPTIHQKPNPELSKVSSIDEALKSVWSDKSLWSDRDFNTYLSLLGITEQDLRGLVLDLGSGISELFSREAQKKGINVISVNPKLSEKIYRSTSAPIEKDTSYERRVVAALAQALPFKNNCFDCVVSVYAVPFYVDSTDLPIVFQEILRILKPGGRAFLSPILTSHRAECETILKDLSCSFSFESNETLRHRYSRLSIKKQ